ncbi:MAG: NAD(P)/FAD-dependent oxidoreductase, partial [Acidobacteriota bacterium]
MKCEVCVLGGGPAGASLARRLAQMGRQVILIEKHPFPRPHIGESLPPGILPLLRTLGLQMQVERVGFLRPRRAVIRWGGEQRRQQEWEGEPGFQVDRGRFDQILLEAARQAGVQIVQPAQAERPVREAKSGWSIPIGQNGGRSEIQARFIADATGRRALLGGRKIRFSAPTLALYAYWRQSGLSGPETRVEAGCSEWFWGAPLPDGSFNAAVFIDPRRLESSASSGSAQDRLECFYRQLLQSSTLLQGCLQGTRMGAV